VGRVLRASQLWTTTCAFTAVNDRTVVMSVARRFHIIQPCGSTLGDMTALSPADDDHTDVTELMSSIHVRSVVVVVVVVVA